MQRPMPNVLMAAACLMICGILSLLWDVSRLWWEAFDDDLPLELAAFDEDLDRDLGLGAVKDSGLTVAMPMTAPSQAATAAIALPAPQPPDANDEESRPAADESPIQRPPLRGATNAAASRSQGDGRLPPLRAPLLDGHGGAQTSRSSGTLFFLFSLYDTLPHYKIWREFLADAPAGSWRAFAHCSDLEGCQRNSLSELLPGIVTVAQMPSMRCTDLVTPQWKLLEEAVKVPKAPGAVDKFILVSGNCLPVKPFGVIYSTLTSYDDSDVCLMEEGWRHKRVKDYDFYLVKHSQWGVLARRHAAKFASRWTSLDSRGRWSFEMVGSQFQGALFYVDRRDKHNWRCADEFALFATIWGLFVPGKFAPRVCPLNSTVACPSIKEIKKQSRCRTMYFFYKDDKSDVLPKLLADPDLKTDWRGDGHPAEFRKLSDESLRIMRQAPFLFARKFVEPWKSGVSRGNFSRIIFDKEIP